MYHIYPESVKAIDPDKWFDLSQWFSSSYLMLKKASNVIWRGQECWGRTVDRILERSCRVGVCERKKKKKPIRVLLYVSQGKGHWNTVSQIRWSLWITVITNTWCGASHFKGYMTIWPTLFHGLPPKVHRQCMFIWNTLLSLSPCTPSSLFIQVSLDINVHFKHYLFQTCLYHFSPVLSHQLGQEDFGYLKFYWLFERSSLQLA